MALQCKKIWVLLGRKFSPDTDTVQEAQHPGLPPAVRAEVLVPRVEPLSHIALTFLPLESTWETPSGLQFITYLQDDPGKIFSDAVACCLNLLMEFPNYIFQLKTIIIFHARCMIT